jgi:hypothetical protein
MKIYSYIKRRGLSRAGRLGGSREALIGGMDLTRTKV